MSAQSKNAWQAEAWLSPCEGPALYDATSFLRDSSAQGLTLRLFSLQLNFEV
jgi:hypothetical protein